MSRYVEGFRDLIVYQKSLKVADTIFAFTKDFPKEEMYSLTDQIRRSSRSIGAQIAEAWGKRRYIRHFVSKLTDADSEQLETQHWLDVCCRCKYVKPEEVTEVQSDLQEIGKMLNSMIIKADSFCTETQISLREDHSEYFHLPENRLILNK